MGRARILLAVAFFGCGDGGQATDGGSDDAAVDAGSTDAAPDVPADVTPDNGIPPLTCTGEVNEPNDKEVLATYLGQIDDCDGSGSTYTDVLSGTGDTDWYRYSGTSPTNLCIVNPTVTIDTAQVRLCEFAVCNEGTTTIASCTNGTPAKSPAGSGGCCTTGTTAMTMKITCSSLTNAADIFIRVDQPTSNICVPYHVAYHY